MVFAFKLDLVRKFYFYCFNFKQLNAIGGGYMHLKIYFKVFIKIK